MLLVQTPLTVFLEYAVIFLIDVDPLFTQYALGHIHSVVEIEEAVQPGLWMVRVPVKVRGKLIVLLADFIKLALGVELTLDTGEFE